MIEVDLNNGMYRRVDLNKPCFCSKCHKEIVRNGKSINLVVNVHTCGHVFCNERKKKLNDFAGNKISKYENKLVEEFVNGKKEKTMFNQWIEMNGGKDGSLYMTFSDEELEQIFLTAVEVYEKNRR